MEGENEEAEKVGGSRGEGESAVVREKEGRVMSGGGSRWKEWQRVGKRKECGREEKEKEEGGGRRGKKEEREEERRRRGESRGVRKGEE